VEGYGDRKGEPGKRQEKRPKKSFEKRKTVQKKGCGPFFASLRKNDRKTVKKTRFSPNVKRPNITLYPSMYPIALIG
jgi:hypothetical protein